MAKIPTAPARELAVLLDDAAASLSRLEQRLAEAGYIPAAACPHCHGTGKTSPRLAEEACPTDTREKARL